MSRTGCGGSRQAAGRNSGPAEMRTAPQRFHGEFMMMENQMTTDDRIRRAQMNTRQDGGQYADGTRSGKAAAAAAVTRRDLAHTGFVYFYISLFVLLFGVVYEYFSYGVYSNFMLYAFAFPLVGGALVFLRMAYSRKVRIPNQTAQNLYHCSLAAWTVGSLLQGILDIYGTTNRLIKVYWITGAVLLAAALVSYLFSGRAGSKSHQ